MRMVAWIIGAAIALPVMGVGAWWAYGQTIETPDYQVLARDGAVTLRAYPPLTVARVTTTGGRRPAVNAGFGPLARYIFAREREGEKIAMTAPVTQTARADSTDADVTWQRQWAVEFIMPSRYRLEDLPRPAGAEVTLDTIPARQVAAIRFGGVATDDRIADQERRLRAWLADLGHTAAAPPIYAYYNDPFTPGFLRRNEVLIPIADPGR